MRWFGRTSNWEASTDLGDVLVWCEAQFAAWYPGDIEWAGWHRNECLWIAKSVTRYCRRNLASGQTQRQLSLIQALKGKHGGGKSGASRRKGTPLEQDRAPWEAEGVSKRTWYYRQAGQHTGQHGGDRRSRNCKLH